MTFGILPLLIVLSAPAAAEGSVGSRAQAAEAVEAFHCDFGETWDKNFDGWPNDWTRKRGRGYPHYVDIKIDAAGPPQGGQSLCVRLDGGGAAASSPAIPVSPLFEYVLELQISAEKLRHDQAFATVASLDAQHRVLGLRNTEKVCQTDGWRPIRLGPFSLDPGTRFVLITLHVEPGALEDLNGVVRFGNVRLARMPHIELTTNEPHQLFLLPGPIEVACMVSGAFTAPPKVHFELADAFGRCLAESVEVPALKPVVGIPSEVLIGEGTPGQGVARWTPAMPGPGWYRLSARLEGPSGATLEEKLSLAVIEPVAPLARGEFGWSLPRGEEPLPLPALARLLTQSGIAWLKYPLWLDEVESDDRVQRLAAFAERLGSHNIEIVGLLGTPPESLRQRFGSPTAPAAEIFACDPKVWYPSIETTLTRFAMQISGWQLGNDDDMSFVDDRRMPTRIAEVKAEMDRIAQDTDLGVPWDWTHAFPTAGRGPAPWRFLSLTAGPPLTAHELEGYLDPASRGPARRDVMIEPLRRGLFGLDVRIVDLVDRMVAAKIGQAHAVFATDPFDASTGLMNADGTPGELYLPWRTTALKIGGARYLGQLTLPGRSENRVFAREGEAIVVVHNERPGDEPFSLGRYGRQTDLWGKVTAMEPLARVHSVAVDRLPSFVTGMSEASARWQMNLALAESRVPAAFNRAHGNELRLVNPFPRGVHGRMTIVAPDAWRIEPRQASFNLTSQEEWRLPLTMLLPNTAGSGRHLLRFDFEIQAEEPMSLSVFRYLDVGLGDVYIEVTSQLANDGKLEVVQRFVNESTQSVSFRCELFIPGRRSLKTQIVALGQGQDVKTYRLDDGAELVGKPLWLRAQEIDGVRVLNYRTTIVQ